MVVIDEAGAVLLFRVEDAQDTKPPMWVTPGGGIEPGESLLGAAVRELLEETGLGVEPEALGEPVAVARGDWEFRGEPWYSEDWYFSLRAERFSPSDAGWTDHEREVHASWRWWTPAELDSTADPVLPAGLAALVRRLTAGDRPATPVELPWTTL